MPKFIDERADRLREMCGHVDGLFTMRPLMAGIRMPAGAFAELRNYVNMYLYDSLRKASARVELTSSMLADYPDAIRALPNITPNGLFLPKRHSLLSYSLMMGCVTSLIKSLGLNGVGQLHYPINLRIVDGTPDPAVDSRPRASTKLHSDIWAGEFPDHVMVFIPLDGDMHSNGVELYEPGEDFFPAFVRPVADYAHGASLIDGATKYDEVMEAGSVYLLDSFLLHRTMKRKPGLRMVINFSARTERKVPSDLAITTDRRDEYIDAADWYDLGHGSVVSTDSVMRKFDPAETSGAYNKYADEYRIVKL